jgi:NAD(P)-dependent dehydrogenase (short-subunit alcohol dehydrogenase family)
VRLVHIASLAASVGVPQRYSYSVAKAALEGLCRQVASDVDASRFAVAAVSPALVNTSFADPVLTESQRADMAARRASAMSAHALAGLLLWLGLEGLPTLSGSCLRLQ